MPRKIILALLSLLALSLYLLIFPPRWLLNLTKQVDISPETGAALVAVLLGE